MTFKDTKDPDATVDFTIDWSDLLAESSPQDTIASSSWTANQGVVVDRDSNTTTTATVWVSGGTVRKYSELVNTVTTAGGRTYERTVYVKVQQR